jgi:FtsP/CotA-like multicopper oxidase with cupredoxin domain
MTHLSRRGFQAASAAVAAPMFLPSGTMASSPVLTLRAMTRTLDIAGRAVTVKGLLDTQGRSGIFLDPSQPFRVDLWNDLDTGASIHWHGQVPPNVQDGVPDAPLPALQTGEMRRFDFTPYPGTHWMHSHIPVQEMELLAAPLIVRRPKDVTADRQEVTILLHDLSFRLADDVLAEITGGTMAGMDHGAGGGTDGSSGSMGGMMGGMSGMDHGEMGGMAMGGMAMGGMDLNDFNFDAFPANDCTLDDPEVVMVEKGGRVLLRVINGSAATVFWIDTDTLQGRAIATDGNPIQSVSGSRFGLAMGQRLDIGLEIPADGGAFPILAFREGAVERTGTTLVTSGAAVAKISGQSEQAHPAFSADLAQEAGFQAVTSLADRPIGRRDNLMLGGSKMPYVWTIDGQSRGGAHRAIETRSGERVALTFHKMSIMAHPMHLHGHHFQVVALNDKPVRGALRDTVHIPPLGRVTVALDAGEAPRWMLHCHHMPHLSTGMMTEFVVSA